MARPFILFSMLCVLGSSEAKGNLCEPLIRRYEAAHGIPHKLLTAISLVESGRKVGGSVVAWPWTICAEKKPYVFATKKEAIAMVHKLRQRGINSIDVGCMQVNLQQHPEAFPTLEAAFDPATNIAYAAKFLKAKKMNMGSWVTAVAHYHSSTAKFHIPYKAKVLKTWAKVQNRKMTFHEPLDPEQSSIQKIMAEMQSHKGAFVNHVSAPSGRRLPMVVQFAPYQGLNKGKNTGPKIIHGWPTKGIGKVIINKMGTDPNQKPFVVQSVEGVQVPMKVINVSDETDPKPVSPKPKPSVISKFRAKPR